MTEMTRSQFVAALIVGAQYARELSHTLGIRAELLIEADGVCVLLSAENAHIPWNRAGWLVEWGNIWTAKVEENGNELVRALDECVERLGIVDLGGME